MLLLQLAFAGCVYEPIKWWEMALLCLAVFPLMLLMPREEIKEPEVYPELKIQWRAILGSAIALLVCFLLAKYGMAFILTLV